MSRYFTERNELRLFPVIRDVFLVLLVVMLLMAFWPLRTVPTGHRGVITVGGKVAGLQNEGFMLVWPWEKLNVFNIRAEQAAIEKAEGATADTQPVHVSISVRYSVLPDKVIDVFEKYSRDGNLDSYIQTATQDTFKAVTARYTATNLIAQRPQVASDITGLLRQKLSIYGAQVVNVDITNFSFSPQYMAAVNEKVTQDQLRQAAENKVKTVEAQQKEKIVTAEAEATAAQKKADGEAYAALKAATAQAESLRIQNAALAQNKDVLELRRIEVEMVKAQTWNGALPQAIYAGAPVPFMSVPTSK